MKKLAAMALALAMLTGVTALAGTEDYTGTWYLNALVLGDANLAPSALGMDMTMEIKDDATLVMSTPVIAEEGAEPTIESIEGTWTLESDTLTVTLVDEEAGEQTMTMNIKDGNLVGEEQGLGLVFGREKTEVETYKPAEANTNATAEDYAGKWIASMLKIDGSYLDMSIFMIGEMTITVEGDSLTFTALETFGEVKFNTAIEDGAVKGSVDETDEVYAGGAVTAQLLQDGKLLFDMTSDGEEVLGLIMERAE